MALLRARARDGVLDMPPDIHDSKKPDIVGLPPAPRAVTRGSEKRISSPNATENHYSQVTLTPDVHRIARSKRTRMRETDHLAAHFMASWAAKINPAGAQACATSSQR
jgi:hypothetical protein